MAHPALSRTPAYLPGMTARPHRGKTTPASTGGSFAAHAHGSSTVALADDPQDALFTIEATSKRETCPDCNGHGEHLIVDHETGRSVEKCRLCKGDGEVDRTTAAHWREQDAEARETAAAAARWPGNVDIGTPPF